LQNNLFRSNDSGFSLLLSGQMTSRLENCIDQGHDNFQTKKINPIKINHLKKNCFFSQASPAEITHLRAKILENMVFF